VARNIYGYRIAEKGRTSARVGSLEDVYSLLDQLNFVVPAYFNQTLNWFILMNRRYGDAVFSLVGLRFSNMPEIAESQGHYRTRQLVDAMAERLHEVIRETDMGTRNLMGTVWLLLPRTDAEGCRKLLKRFSSIEEMIPADLSVKPVFTTVCLTAPEGLEARDNAAVLLSRLSEELEV
jgi:GGDEF domain-containing protein